MFRFSYSVRPCAGSSVSLGCVTLLLVNALVTMAGANPFAPMTSAVPGPSQLVPTAKEVPGKDFSDNSDRDEAGAADREQVVAWDGLGGVRDSFDYSGSRLAYPGADIDLEVDGLAADFDSLFFDVRADRSALLFSVESDPEILFERATGFPAAPAGFGTWATAADVDAMNPPADTDALEVWGGNDNDDSLRYSLAGDPFVQLGLSPSLPRKVAVWQYSTPAGPSSPLIYTSDLAASIDMQFGFDGSGPYFSQLVESMDVDAIMVLGVQLIFSIQPITVPGTPIAFDGGEIFEYDGPGMPTRFLNHGGHDWDTAFDVMGTFHLQNENIDALEAVSQFVPEPTSAMLLLMGLVAARRFKRR